MKGAVPLCSHTQSAQCHGQKAWSGLKYALNKLSGGTEREMKEKTQTGSTGVTEEDKGGRRKRWTHKYNDEKWCKTWGAENQGHKTSLWNYAVENRNTFGFTSIFFSLIKLNGLSCTQTFSLKFWAYIWANQYLWELLSRKIIYYLNILLLFCLNWQNNNNNNKRE